jgi:hypothetical protein
MVTLSSIVRSSNSGGSGPYDQELRKKVMTDEKNNQEIETSVLALGTAYLATLLGMIYVLAA